MHRSGWFAFVVVGLSVGCGGGGGDDTASPDAGASIPDGMVFGTDAGSFDADPMSPDAGASGDGSTASAAPLFAGISFGVSPTPTEVELRWLAAVDDATPAGQIRYLVFQGGAADSLSTNPVAEVTGAETITINGLTADSTYFFQVVAEDADGNRSVQRPAVEIDTVDVALNIAKMPKDVAAMGLTVVENGLNDFTLTGASAPSIAVGDLLVIDNTFGRSLREVATVSINGNVNDITTIKASLDEVIDGGTIGASGVLADPVGQTPGPQQITLWSPKPRVEAPARIERVFGDGIEMQTRRLGTPTVLHSTNHTLDTGVTLEFAAGFQPSFKTKARYDSVTGKPKLIRAVAKGSFTLDAVAKYNLTAAAEVKAKQTLLSKSYTFTYAVGGLPVVQDVKLEFIAEADLSFQGAIDAEANLHAEKTLTFGFQWTESQGFQLIQEDGFERTITFNLMGEAEAKGVLRVYPVISTTFYKVATASLNVKPSLTLDAKARFIPTPVEITQFDVTFFVSLQVQADITIFGLELLAWKSDEYKLIEIPIHSQHELTLRKPTKQLDTCGKQKVYLQVADGYNNLVDLSTVQWSVDPTTDVTLTTTGNPLIAEIEATTAGTYTVSVSASGQGFLGALGVRYATLDVNIVDAPMGNCDPANSQGEEVMQCLTNTLPDHLGLTGPPSFDKTMYAPGETARLSMPACVDTSCVFYGFFATVEQGGGFPFTNNIPLHDAMNLSTNDPPIGVISTSDAPFTIDIPIPANAEPGQWVAGVLSFELNQPLGRYYSHYGADGTAYELNQYNFDIPESCDNQPTSFPVPYVNIVAPDGSDGNDTPKEGTPLAINGGKVASRVSQNDGEDWYTIAPSDEGGNNAVFDSDITYDPECYVTIRVSNDNGYLRERCAYPTLADAENDTNALVCFDGDISFKTTAGQTFYVRVKTSVPDETYEIEATSSCADPLAIFAQLTTSPSPSVNPFNAGAIVDITSDFTNNTTQLRATIRNDSGTAGSTTNVAITPPATQGVSSYDTWKSNLSTEYWITVDLTAIGGHTTTYIKDPAVSSTNYAVTYDRADGLTIGPLDSGIPITTVMTN